MNYKYVKYELGSKSGSVSDFGLVAGDDVTNGNVVQAIPADPAFPTVILDSLDKFESFAEGRRRALVWPGPSANTPLPTMKEYQDVKLTPQPVKGDHYQGYIGELQWIDAMSLIPKYRDPVLFKAALELQIRKYFDRLGRKDNELQELMKALWYMKYLCAYIKNDNNPIKGKDVDDILKA